LHEARHTFASMLIEADVSPKKVSTYMGHESIAITLDRYASSSSVTSATRSKNSTRSSSGLIRRRDWRRLGIARRKGLQSARR